MTDAEKVELVDALTALGRMLYHEGPGPSRAHSFRGTPATQPELHAALLRCDAAIARSPDQQPILLGAIMLIANDPCLERLELHGAALTNALATRKELTP